MANNDDYEVGYGKPPKHSRFKPGQSGNPRGRPKQAEQQVKDVADLVREYLDQPIDLMLGGKQVRMQAKEAVARQIVNRAVKGDLKAVTFVEQLAGRSLGRTADQIRVANPQVDEGLTETDEEVIEHYAQRLLETAGNTDDDGGTLQ